MHLHFAQDCTLLLAAFLDINNRRVKRLCIQIVNECVVVGGKVRVLLACTVDNHRNQSGAPQSAAGA